MVEFLPIKEMVTVNMQAQLSNSKGAIIEELVRLDYGNTDTVTNGTEKTFPFGEDNCKSLEMMFNEEIPKRYHSWAYENQTRCT